jgi:hypothetical protein
MVMGEAFTLISASEPDDGAVKRELCECFPGVVIFVKPTLVHLIPLEDLNIHYFTKFDMSTNIATGQGFDGPSTCRDGPTGSGSRS